MKETSPSPASKSGTQAILHPSGVWRQLSVLRGKWKTPKLSSVLSPELTRRPQIPSAWYDMETLGMPPVKALCEVLRNPAVDGG